MSNYSELYSLPSASGLSLPHYNSGKISYLNYSKPISRYTGVYKSPLSTISEIISPYRRLNASKLTYPTDISSRPLKPIKVINTADIDVSVNKYKKFEKKVPRLKGIDSKHIPEQPADITVSKPKPPIRRDRATVRIRTVHADTVKQEIGAFKTWRDNFEPNELVDKVKTRKKTKGEILKEKFLIRSRSKDNISTIQTVGKKLIINKAPSFRDICTAITSENISDDLNPGQPEEVLRRQSKQLSSENLLKEIRRVSTELSPEDLNLLNTILLNQGETSDSSDESVASVDLSNFRGTSSLSCNNESVEESDITPLTTKDDKTVVEETKPEFSIKNQNLKNEGNDYVIKNSKKYEKNKPDILAEVDVSKKVPIMSSKETKLNLIGEDNQRPQEIKNELQIDTNNLNISDKKQFSENDHNLGARQKAKSIKKPDEKNGDNNQEAKLQFIKEKGTSAEDTLETDKSVSQKELIIDTPTTRRADTKSKLKETIQPDETKNQHYQPTELKLDKEKEVLEDNCSKYESKKQSGKDISDVEIQEIKFKMKPVITSSVEDIHIPKQTLVAVVDEVEVEKPVRMEKKLKFNVSVNIEPIKGEKKNKRLKKASIKEGTVIHPLTQKCVKNVILQNQNNKQIFKKIKPLPAIKKAKKKNNKVQDKNIIKSPSLQIVPENNICVESSNNEIEVNTSEYKPIEPNIESMEPNTINSINTSENHDISTSANQSDDELNAALQNPESLNEQVPTTSNSETPTKITSKMSLLKKPNIEDPDLLVFVAPPEPEPSLEEKKEDVFIPLQSNRLTQWMHPWAKPEQFDECPVEIFARPKVIRGRHYPRPRKRNNNNNNVAAKVLENSLDNEKNASDSDENSSSEDTSGSMRSNDSGFGSTIPEKINVSQEEQVNEQCEPSDKQTPVPVVAPPESGKIIPPATTMPRFRKYSVEDFDFLKVLGKGSFGKVVLSKLKETDYYYAVKCLKKDVIVEDDDVECTLIERKVLALGTRHPFLCHLLCTFQTESHLYFVMEYLNGGDLMFHITTRGSFPEEEARFYSAEIISGLQFLHSKGIIYRDLKLDNVLLDFDGHARLADFGMCQLQIFLDRMAESFCGTPDYMAPEIIKGQHYNQAVDWWSFGVLLYELFLGQSPFSGCDEDELFWSICNEKPVFPKHLSTYAIDILTLLLEKDQSKRLGNRFSPHGPIRDHNFYRNLDWFALEARQVEPPFKPNLNHPLDTQYFDTYFTKDPVKLTPTEVEVVNTIDQSQFQGFSYTNPNATDK